MLIERIKRDFHQSYQSIKLIEIEETFDIYFSRFFGYYLALLGKSLRLTPNQVSVLSLIFGLVAGVLFFFQDQLWITFAACFLLSFSGVLDSADGQLARMTGQSSDLGRKIDAIIDTLVFIACYVGGSLYFFQNGFGWSIFLLAALAGYFHSAKSGAYEYYKTEFIYYVKKAKDHRIPYVEEVKSANVDGHGIGYWLLYYLELDYVRKQALFHGRKKKNREIFEQEAFGQNADQFAQFYSATNTRIMSWWALVCGTNTHRTVLMVTSLFGRMDWYFYFSIITILPMIPIVKWQNRLDDKLVDQLKNDN